MTLDFGEVLTRAWQITWKHKILWIFGLLMMSLALLFFPLGFAPAFSIMLAEDVPVWIEQPAVIFGFFVIFAFLMVGSLFLSTLMQAAISLGVLHAERGSEKLFFREILRGSLPYFWRFMGIIAMLMGGVLLVLLGYFALYVLVALVTFGLGAMCLVPLQFLMYPLMIVAYAWQEQALASIIVDELSVMDAARRGWQVFRNNILPVVLITLILYLGVGMLGGLVSIPLMAPFFLLPIALVEEIQNINIILIVASLCVVAYLPVLAIFQSGALTFMKSGWILTYLRLTRSPDEEIHVSPSG
jgi:hypothetical protein